MIRKTLLGAALTLGLGALAFGTDLFTFGKTAFTEARTGLRDAVPVSFEIKAARQKLTELDPAVAAAKRVVAEQQIAVERLQGDLARRSAALEEQAREMAFLRNAIGSDREIRHVGRVIREGDMKRDLAARLTAYETAKTTLGHREALLDAQQRTLAANERKLDAMLTARGQLEVQIEQLEAKHQMVQARETIAGVEIDDTALSDTRDLIQRIDDELSVRERMLDEDGSTWEGAVPVSEIVAEQAAAEDAAARYDALFGATVQAEIVGDEA
jgi:chromosome segregation ATPase